MEQKIINLKGHLINTDFSKSSTMFSHTPGTYGETGVQTGEPEAAGLDVASERVLKGCAHHQNHSPTKPAALTPDCRSITFPCQFNSILKLASLHPPSFNHHPFVYRENRSQEDAITTGHQRDLKHTHTQMLFLYQLQLCFYS